MSRADDIALGVRLAVGGGRTLKTSLLRLVLTTAGIGLTTALLLLVVTVASALGDRSDRIADRRPATTGWAATPVYVLEHKPTGDITVDYLESGGPDAPVPPGLRALPRPGQLVVSPALAKRMAEDPATRRIFDQQIVGTIGPEGLAQSDELWAYAGATGLRDAQDVKVAHGFGDANGGDTPGSLLALGGFGLLVLVAPMLVFVAGSSRVGGAERERRLSALRLAGAGVKQVRRVAAAEALVGAASGAVVGLVLYLVVRPLVADVSIAGVSVYPDDFAPGWWSTLLVFALIPLLAVGSAWLGLRGLIIEPLAVFRRGKPVRRKGWWRLVLVAIGVALMFPDKLFGVADKPSNTAPFVCTGAGLLLFGVTVLLPWFTERAVGRLRGGPPAWQLAVRRLQLDSGTPSRVITGVVVVLTAVVCLQTVLGSLEQRAARVSSEEAQPGEVSLSFDASSANDVVAAAARVPGVEVASAKWWGSLRGPNGYSYTIVASCAALERDYQLPSCADGDTFLLGDAVAAGGTYDVSDVGGGPSTRFTVPANAKRAGPLPGKRAADADYLVTPAAAAGLPVHYTLGTAYVDTTKPGVVAALRAALSKYEWRAQAWATDELIVLDHSGAQTVSAIGGMLSAGAVLTMLLGGVSMLVLIVGQVSERRRPMAAMSAAGVPTRVLGRSLLWQNAIPLALGVVAAVGAGIAIAAMTLRIMAEEVPFTLDLPFVAVVAGVVVLLVFAVTGAALPGLRSATKLEAMRME